MRERGSVLVRVCVCGSEGCVCECVTEGVCGCDVICV